MAKTDVIMVAVISDLIAATGIIGADAKGTQPRPIVSVQPGWRVDCHVVNVLAVDHVGAAEVSEMFGDVEKVVPAFGDAGRAAGPVLWTYFPAAHWEEVVGSERPGRIMPDIGADTCQPVIVELVPKAADSWLDTGIPPFDVGVVS